MNSRDQSTQSSGDNLEDSISPEEIVVDYDHPHVTSTTLALDGVIDNMSPDNRSTAEAGDSIDPRAYRNIDWIAYTRIGVYSLIHLLWVAWVFTGKPSGIFESASLIGLVLPIVGLLLLIKFQLQSRRYRFSLLANLLSIGAVAGWFFFTWYLVAEASASI